MNAGDFQTQLTSIMQMLTKSAVMEISKLFEKNSLFLRLEISRCTNENESLKKKCHYLEAELQSARKTAGNINGTEAPFGRPGLAGTAHPLTIDKVFGKEWCAHQLRLEDCKDGGKDETRLNASDIIGEPIDLVHGKPEAIVIKEETFEDCSKKATVDEGSMLRGSTMAIDESCVIQGSDGGDDDDEEDDEEDDDEIIKYMIPSDDQIQSPFQQSQAVKPNLSAATSAHGNGLVGLNLNPDVGFFHNAVAFSSQHNLPTNSEEKKFECVFCGKSFSYLSYLKVHMRTHSGEKPFVCTVCGKRFAQKTYLRIHQRTHSGERPYTCLACGKSFSQKSSLNVHGRSHTGEKPYSCVDCGKSYTYKHGFNTHQCVS